MAVVLPSSGLSEFGGQLTRGGKAPSLVLLQRNHGTQTSLSPRELKNFTALCLAGRLAITVSLTAAANRHFTTSTGYKRAFPTRPRGSHEQPQLS